MYTLQYSQITHSGSSSRCIYGGLKAERSKTQVLNDWLSSKCFVNCAVKSEPGFVHSRKVTNASMSFTVYLSLKRVSNLWLRCMLSRRVSLTCPLFSKCALSLFLKSIARNLYHIVREWWWRSYRPGSNEGFFRFADMDLADHQSLASRISKLPQFHMGADPILMSAFRWQGCHYSNHGGN